MELLLQFSVENFRSFKDKFVLSMEAGSEHSLPDNVAVTGKEKLLRSAVIFGANAAGKSNIFKALTTAILLVRTSNNRQAGEKLSTVVPFLFSADTKDEPSSFEFVFIAEDKKKYVYGFSATQARIVSEYLYKYNSVRPTTIFERDEQREGEKPQYRFTVAALKKELSPIVERNTDNKLFLATATAWNSKETIIPFSWFQNIDTYSTNYNELLPRIAPLLENDADNSLKKFICKTLQEADINIQDYTFESKDVPENEFLQRMPSQLVALLPDEIKHSKHKAVDIKFKHHVENDSSIEDYSLNIRDESEGTSSLFLLSPLLKESFDKGKILCVDEFDTSLHPMLVVYLVGLFNNPEINKANAQLIISTHTTELLSTDIMRRDQIYFVDKDNKTGVSELYSLDEFQATKNKDIRKSYLLGRYGALPNIQDGEILW